MTEDRPRLPTDYVSLLREARRLVEGSVLYKRFIDGTPLENDIAVWMADFATTKFDLGKAEGIQQERARCAKVGQERKDYVPLKERVEAITEALYAAGIRSRNKDGRPSIIAEGVYMNLRRVQRMDLGRTTPASVEDIAIALAAIRRSEEG